MLNNLSTEKLLEVFKKAMELNLSKDFIKLLNNELNKRFIDNSVIVDYRKSQKSVINSDINLN